MKDINFKLLISSVTKLDDGRCEIAFRLDEEFVKWFKEHHGLKRWSQKKFDTFINKTLAEQLNNMSK